MAQAKTHKPAPKLTDAEIAALTDAATRAWEKGETVVETDSLGARWTFEPVRDENMRLLIRREVQGDGGLQPGGDTFMTGAEFGLEDARWPLASRILAVAST